MKLRTRLNGNCGGLFIRPMIIRIVLLALFSSIFSHTAFSQKYDVGDSEAGGLF